MRRSAIPSTATPASATPAITARSGPAAGALFAFVTLELAHPTPGDPRTLGIAAALYSYWALAGMAVYGRETWTRHGEGFAVAFELLSRMAPFAVRDGRVVIRWPLTGLAGKLMAEAVMGTAERFDVFARLPHAPFPGGELLRMPMLVSAMAWFRLRDLF